MIDFRFSRNEIKLKLMYFVIAPRHIIPTTSEAGSHPGL